MIQRCSSDNGKYNDERWKKEKNNVFVFGYDSCFILMD